jgi:hypothetical protein
MNKSSFFTILVSPNYATVRLGWVSPSTGLTYCGICLRAAVLPEVGAECSGCGALVARLFDLREGPDSIRQAWKEASLAASAYGG